MATRIIRWVGHPSPFDDHNVRRRIMNKALHPEIALQFSAFEHNRRISVRRGHSTFHIDKRHGFTRDYTWGPRYFDVEMEERDWQRLARIPFDRFMFLDVTQGVPRFRPLLTPVEWRDLLESTRKTPPPQVHIDRFTVPPKTA